MSQSRSTKDGLPVVTETTFGQVVTTYPIASPNGDPKVRKRIEYENPQVHRILELGSRAASTPQACAYYQMGVEITYELLRAQSAKDKKS